jgi:hypothetical protein
MNPRLLGAFFLLVLLVGYQTTSPQSRTGGTGPLPIEKVS